MKQLQLIRLEQRIKSAFYVYFVIEDGKVIATRKGGLLYYACHVHQTSSGAFSHNFYGRPDLVNRKQLGAYALATVDHDWTMPKGLNEDGCDILKKIRSLLRAGDILAASNLVTADLQKFLPPDVKVVFNLPLEDKSLERAIRRSLEFINHFTQQQDY